MLVDQQINTTAGFEMINYRYFKIYTFLKKVFSMRHASSISVFDATIKM